MAEEELNGEVHDDPIPAAPERPRAADGKFAAVSGAFDKAVDSLIEDRMGDEAPVASAEPTDTIPAEDTPLPDAAPVKSEGPSEDLRTVALLAGVDESLLSIAKDDDQLRAIIQREVSRKQQAPAAPAAEPARREPEATAPVQEPLAKVLFSDEEFPTDDPHRQQAKHLADAVNAVAEYFGNELAELREKFETQNQTLGNTSERQAQVEFDRMADEFGHPILGKKSDIAGRGQAEHIAREATYHALRRIRESMPDIEPALAMEFAFRKAFPKARLTTNNQAKQDALLRQSASRLGGDPAPAAREPALPQGTRFDKALQSYLRR